MSDDPSSAVSKGVLSPATLLGARQMDLASRATGRTYRIFIQLPLIPPPPQGYPVIYLTDGDAAFGIAASSMWIRQHGELPPAVIVGVGYGLEDYRTFNERRSPDLTPATPTHLIPQRFVQDGRPMFNFGESEAFLRFITEEVRPALAGVAPVDPDNQTLVGVSLGGLFTLEALFKTPRAFRSYIAISPSIWWGDRQVLTHEAAFGRQVQERAASPRVMIGVGALEQTPVEIPDAPEDALRAYRDEIQAARMIDNARELADRLSALSGGPGYEVAFHLFAGETHGSVAAVAVSRALEFALASD